MKRLTSIISSISLTILALSTMAPIAMSKPLPTKHPRYCLAQNMNDGVISWRYTVSLYGVNYYRYSSIKKPVYRNGRLVEGTGSCRYAKYP